jgi:hypothetical protein
VSIRIDKLANGKTLGKSGTNSAAMPAIVLIGVTVTRSSI